jgi:hypothetical protein
MIHYELQCDNGHNFDGWFPGSAAFESQCAAGQIECPRCGTSEVSRALMAPAVGRGAAPPAPPSEPAKPPAAPRAELVSALQKVRELVERNCDYVGADFADQATRMHRGEIAARGIYGETSEIEADTLRDDGVPITSVPWVPRAH